METPTSSSRPRSTIADAKAEALSILTDDLTVITYLSRDLYADLAILDSYVPTNQVTELSRMSAISKLETAVRAVDDLREWIGTQLSVIKSIDITLSIRGGSHE